MSVDVTLTSWFNGGGFSIQSYALGVVDVKCLRSAEFRESGGSIVEETVVRWSAKVSAGSSPRSEREKDCSSVRFLSEVT